ncbi:MAG: ribonuclease T2 [Pseudomonadota bacterium]
MRWLLVAMLLVASPSLAEDEAGVFDYYVLALSWSPNWCAAEGDARGADQCDPRHDYGFILHGLWPQYERGWPADCATDARDPSRAETAAMVDIMGSSGLAWHQWRKHGRCSGLAGRDYLALSRAAFERIQRPAVLRQVSRSLEIPPEVIEAAFLEENPGIVADGLTVTCRDGRLQEVRICLSRELEPRICGADVVRDCGRQSVRVEPIR